MQHTPWKYLDGVDTNGKHGWYVIDATGEPIWTNGGSDGGVCSLEKAALIAAAPEAAAELARIKAQRDELLGAAKALVDKAESVLGDHKAVVIDAADVIARVEKEDARS